MFLQSDDDKKKKKKIKSAYVNPFEAFEDIGKGIAHQTKDQFANGAKDAIRQVLFGAGELKPGEPFDVKAHEEKKKVEAQAANIEPGINNVGEILHSYENKKSEDNKKL